jgi:hypothetical protein
VDKYTTQVAFKESSTSIKNLRLADETPCQTQLVASSVAKVVSDFRPAACNAAYPRFLHIDVTTILLSIVLLHTMEPVPPVLLLRSLQDDDLP